MSHRNQISAYIIVKNESHNIEAAISSLSLADEIIILDTGSSDDTMEKAKALGATVIESPFEGFGKARQRALAACQYPWILTIDADERITADLENEIIQTLQSNPSPFIGFAPSKNIVMDRWMKHGGWYPDYRLPVFFAKAALTYKDDYVHEGIDVTAPAFFFKAPRLHYAYQKMDMLLTKANQYAHYGAQKLAKKGVKPSLWRGLGHAAWKFIKQYLIRGGCLDGWPGFIFSVNAFNETFFRYLIHHEQETKLKRIVISRCDNIGDVVLTLPMVAVLKQKYPDAKILFLARDYVRAVVEAYPLVDEFISSDQLLAKTSEQAVQQLVDLQADAIIHVFPKSRLAKLAKQAKIPMRIGTRRRLYHLFTCTHRVDFSRAKSATHEAQLNLQLLAPLHCPSDLSLKTLSPLGQINNTLPLPDKLAKLFDPTRVHLIIHPLSNGNGREWPLARYVELIQSLSSSRIQILITGSSKEHDRLKQPLIDRCPQVVDLTGQLSLDAFLAVIAKADILLASSTGPLHMAAATGIQAVGLFPLLPNIDAKRWGPLGPKTTVIEATAVCGQCQTNADACQCMQSISSDKVRGTIHHLAEKIIQTKTNIEKQPALGIK